MTTSNSLEHHNLKDLRTLARLEGLAGYSRLKKEELVTLLDQAQAKKEGISQGIGYLQTQRDGRGFLRSLRQPPSELDPYVSPAQIKRFALRNGDLVEGPVRQPKEGEKYRSLLQVTAVNGIDPDEAMNRPRFESLTPVFPDQQYVLETKPHILGTRIIDLVCPIGRGQRGLIVSPPKAGKTTLLKQIANGLSDNYKSLYLMVVLVGERPEEVTDMRRSIDALVISSTFDDPVEQHISMVELALDHAVRLVEMNRDVVILLDSLTRLTRAYNLALAASARNLSTGLDPAALHPAKRFFGSARKLEGSGSLTILATCLVETGSRIDDMIYEEFKGTGNMEMQLDHSLAERRIFPAVNIERSSTRREELLLDSATLQHVWTMRRMMEAIRASQPNAEPYLAIRDRLRRTRDNREFLASLNHRES